MATRTQGHQEGSRWIDKRPSGKEVADWFIANAPMHPGMDPQRYVTGVVLIPASEKVPGSDAKQQVYVPYVKVETRVSYFWDYLRTLDGVTGAIVPADVIRLETEGVYNMNLPPGFFRLPVQESSGKFVHFLCCSMKVRLSKERLIATDPFISLVEAPTGTKMVAMLSKWGVDEHSIMKAETGAVGRALGMAGMLVLPGSGVATAEDMQEMAESKERPSVGVDAALPAGPPAAPDDVIRDQIQALSLRLQSENPGAYEELEAWAREKKIDMADLKSHQLRGLLRSLEKKLEEGSS